MIPPISPSGGAERRPPSSQSSNRTPPSTTTSAPYTVPTPSSAIQDQPKENKSGTCDSSIYCFLCSLNTTRSFAHWLPSSPSSSDPAAPYFPYILNYAAGSRAEGLREDGAALVCTFCYHMVNCPKLVINQGFREMHLLKLLIFFLFYSLRFTHNGSSTRMHQLANPFSLARVFITHMITSVMFVG